jgi:hypothetical protein
MVGCEVEGARAVGSMCLLLLVAISWWVTHGGEESDEDEEREGSMNRGAPAW